MGWFAHKVIDAHFLGVIYLNKYALSISRLDLRVNLHSFQLGNYAVECNRLEQFLSQQRRFFSKDNKGYEITLKNDPSSDFACITFHKRRAGFYLRMYIDPVENRKTCEIELKKQCLTLIKKAIKTRDIKSFNELCILE